jgi:hypothetical protein
MKHLAKLAMSADRLIQDVADQFNGNAARRHEMRMRAIELGDQLRRQRWARKHAKSNHALGRAPQGHRLMLILTAKNHSHSV